LVEWFSALVAPV